MQHGIHDREVKNCLAVCGGNKYKARFSAKFC